MIIQASNLSLTDGQESARLIADVASGSATVTVNNISGFAVDQYVLIGNFGEPSAEILKLHGSTAPTGSTITFSSNTTKDHYSDSPITVIDFNQVEFSRATTLTGSKVVLTTKNISTDRLDTAYTDSVNTTGYAFFRFKNGTNFSVYSSGVSYDGISRSSVQSVVDKACRDSGVTIGDDFATEEMLLSDAQDVQNAVTEYDWKFEIVKNDASLTARQYENTYLLSGLTYELKYPGIVQGIKSVKLGGRRLDYVDNDVMDEYYKNTVRTTVATQAEIGDTSLVLINTAELPDNGSVYVNGLLVSYTTNTKSTNTLSGISALSITSVLPINSIVWYNVNVGLPNKYTVTISNELVFNCPISINYNGYSIVLEYQKKLNEITDFASIYEVPFAEDLSDYIKAKIEQRKRNFDNYDKFMTIFNESIKTKLNFYKLPVMDNMKYYNFFDEGRSDTFNNNYVC